MLLGSCYCTEDIFRIRRQACRAHEVTAPILAVFQNPRKKVTQLKKSSVPVRHIVKQAVEMYKRVSNAKAGHHLCLCASTWSAPPFLYTDCQECLVGYAERNLPQWRRSQNFYTVYIIRYRQVYHTQRDRHRESARSQSRLLYVTGFAVVCYIHKFARCGSRRYPSLVTSSVSLVFIYEHKYCQGWKRGLRR